MNNLLAEDVVTLSEATKDLPPVSGSRFSTSTLWRWCRVGLGPRKVKLEHVRLGRRILTSREALNRFFCALAEDDAYPLSQPFVIPTRERAPKSRDREIARANADLDRAGI